MFVAVGLWLVLADLTVAHVVRPRLFSWETLPVFFHSQNISGPWSEAALKQIARYSMATNEKAHAMKLPNGSRQSEEIAGPEACRQIEKENTGTDSFFYLNSLIDWPTNVQLHGLMVKNPSWRLKDISGRDIDAFPGKGIWQYNLTNDRMRAAWVQECVHAVKNGCTGCFVDRAGGNEFPRTWPQTSHTAIAYKRAHLAALRELSEALEPSGGYLINNHLGMAKFANSAMMVEDFAGTEKCIETLQLIASRGLTIQAHAGNLPHGNKCLHGDTNALAAFLIGAGNYSYYHCSIGWQSNAEWPEVNDTWLDWLPEYDFPLGRPLGLAVKTGSVWRRKFASGTHVEFDGNTNKGTIWWMNGVVQSGFPVASGAVANGCQWESLESDFSTFV